MKTSRALRIGLVVALSASVAGAAGGSAGGGVNVTIDADRGVERCSDVRVRFDFRDAERGEDTFTIPASGNAFRVALPANSGIRVTGWDRNEISVTACKAARERAGLEEIRVTPEGSGLAFRGPSGDDWLVYLLVKAPRSGALELEAKNGSISVKDVAGAVAARTVNGPIGLENSSGDVRLNATNGPISLERCSGTGEARAVNGPIDFSGGEGQFRLSTQNGPISVELEGDSWGRGSLDARAVNGPLTLKLSDSYRSGVVVESLGNSPFSCPASACGKARKSWDDGGRRVEFGDSEPVVRLSTRNGPVSIHGKD